jgi:hypothetical protein
MARLDFFVHCLKAEGIYTNLNLNVSRLFSEDDGVKQAEWMGYGKALTYFDPQLIALQKEYAAQLLGHHNPFTGARYAEEPAVALIELANENSILESWLRGNLKGAQTEPFGTWGDIPPAYASDLDRIWNHWLAGKYLTREALATAWDGGLSPYEDAAKGSVRRLLPEAFAEASQGRFTDEASFYAEIERDYFTDMADYLRGELNVRQPIIGTRHGWGGILQLQTTSVLGITDGHCYWQHPHYHDGSWMTANWSITNTAMVDAPDHSAVAQLSRGKVEGMPYTCTEINEPFPNDYACEFIPILAAYGQLQDWDGLFFFAYGGGSAEEDWDWERKPIPRFFSMANDPVKMAQTAIGALAFLRGDVQKARKVVGRQHTRHWALDSLREYERDDSHPFWFPELQGRLALVHRTEVSDFAAEHVGTVPRDLDLPKGVIRSDTGELCWVDTPGASFVTVDTPRHQAVIGWAGKRQTANLTIDTETRFAAVQLASLDGKPIGDADQMLLVAGARVANTDMRWVDDARQSVGHQWGKAPTRFEPVTGALTLAGLSGAQSVSLQPLDVCGQPAGQPRPGIERGGFFELLLEWESASVWYLIDVSR